MFSADTLMPLKEALVGSIYPSQLISILAAIIGVGMAFVLMWFAVRHLKNIFVSAVTKGKIYDFYRSHYIKHWQKKQYKIFVKEGYKGSYNDFWGE